MTISDPTGDMLTRIRNGVMARHDFVLVPVSGLKLSIARILREQGLVGDYEVLRGKPQRMIRIRLKYLGKREPILTGLQRVSKPGLRVYVEKREIPRVYGGLGIAILSTSKGVMTGEQAWRKGLGGELLCYVW